MNLSIFIESEPGHGQDTAISGQNYAFVFDGLGGKGGKPRTNAAGERELEAKIASSVSAKALKKLLKERLDGWSSLIQNERHRSDTPDEIATEITVALNDALQAAAKEWNADTLPTTISGWLLFPLPDKTFYALAIWAGDSRCYTIDDRCMKLYTQDDTAENQRADAMEELMLSGSPAISNRLGVDKKVRLNHTSLIVDHRILLLTCSDGIYGYVLSPMHLEYYLRNLGAEDSVERMVAVWNKFFLDSNLLQDDSATLEGIFVGERPDDLAEFKEMLLAPLDELEEKYITSYPEPPQMMDSDEQVRGIGVKLGKNDAFRAALAKNIRRCAEKGVPPPDGFPYARFVAELREKQPEWARLKKHSIEEQCRQAEEELDQLIDDVKYPVPTLEDVMDSRKEIVVRSLRQHPPETLHEVFQRVVNHLFSIYYSLIPRYNPGVHKYTNLSWFEMYDHDPYSRTRGSYPPPPPINFCNSYPPLTEDGIRKKAGDLENALFDIRILTDEILDPYYPREKLVRAGGPKLRQDLQELSSEQKKELKQWLIEAAGMGCMELQYCGGNFTLDLSTLDRLLKAARRYRDVVNADADGTDVLQEEIDRYAEESAEADARYLARKWFENGRIEGFELPPKLAASIQKHIDKVHDAKKARLDAFEQYRLDRLELWKQYKPGFEAWSEEQETGPATGLGPGSRSERKGESESVPHEMKGGSEPRQESLSGPEMGSETKPKDAPAFSALMVEEKEPGSVADDETDEDGFRPYEPEKIELGRRD